MSNLNHKGPDNLGPKTGKQLGNCRKKASDTHLYSENRPCRKGSQTKL